MGKRTDTSERKFSKTARTALKPNQEITENGLIWRKLSDNTGVWRYDFREAGKRIKGVIGKDRDGVTMSQAREKLKEIKATSFLERNKRNEYESIYREMRFEDVADEYLKWVEINRKGFRQTNGRMRNQLKPFFEGMKISEITGKDISNFQTQLLQNKLSNRTVELCICLLSSVYKYMQVSDSTIDNPTRNIQKPRKVVGKIETVTDEEFNDLYKSCHGETKYEAIIGLAYYAGLRASEILGLEWDNVNLEDGLITICKVVVEGDVRETTKSGKTRVVPISNNLMGILKRHREIENNKKYVVSTDDGTHYHHVQKMFYTIKNRMKNPFSGGVHVLRHTFATNAVKRNIDVPTLQIWLGHSDIATTMRYVHITPQHSINKMKLMK